MRFEEALKAMRDGKSVTRKAYNDEYLYIIENLNKEPIMFIKKKYEPRNCVATINIINILAEDWEIVDD
jgi:hypothetical protein